MSKIRKLSKTILKRLFYLFIQLPTSYNWGRFPKKSTIIAITFNLENDMKFPN